MVLGHRHEHSAKAICNTDIYVLTREDLHYAFAAFPDDKEKVVRATQEQMKRSLEKRKGKPKISDSNLFSDSPSSGSLILNSGQEYYDRKLNKQQEELVAPFRATNERRPSLLTGYPNAEEISSLNPNLNKSMSKFNSTSRKSIQRNPVASLEDFHHIMKGSIARQGFAERKSSSQSDTNQEV